MSDNNDKYVEPVDYTASQESVESFGSKLGIKQGGEANKDKDKNGPARRSDRNLEKKDAIIENFAKERATKKDKYGKNDALSSQKTSLINMPSLIGVNLGCSVAIIDQNLDLISIMEQDRKYFYLKKTKMKNKKKNLALQVTLTLVMLC